MGGRTVSGESLSGSGSIPGMEKMPRTLLTSMAVVTKCPDSMSAGVHISDAEAARKLPAAARHSDRRVRRQPHAVNRLHHAAVPPHRPIAFLTPHSKQDITEIIARRISVRSVCSCSNPGGTAASISNSWPATMCVPRQSGTKACRPTWITARYSSPANPSCANTKPSSSWPTTKSVNSAARLPSTTRRWSEFQSTLPGAV